MYDNSSAIQSTPHLQSEQPQTKSNVLVLALGALACMAIGAFGYKYTSEYLSQQHKNTPTPGTPQVLNDTGSSRIPSTPPTISQAKDQWKLYEIRLYNLSLNIPSIGWNVQEVNRIPEPTGVGFPSSGHDCAEYKVQNEDSTAVLTLRPNCGYADGGPNYWPDDAVVVKENKDGTFIIRFFDTKRSVYVYSSGLLTTISDDKGTHIEKMHSVFLDIKKDNDALFIRSDLTYSGKEENKAELLKTVDEIVSSIK